MGPEDLDVIMALERTAFEPSIQADTATILARFALGHRMLGAFDGEDLVGAIGFSSIELGGDFDRVPGLFKAYSTQPVPPNPDTVCIYSLGIVPSARGLRRARLLIDSAFNFGRSKGLQGVLADGPIPSFAGNDQVRVRPEVRRTIERYLATGEFPPDDDLLKDPVLALYRRLTGCRFVRLLAGFLPEDEASGGWRVLLHRDL